MARIFSCHTVFGANTFVKSSSKSSLGSEIRPVKMLQLSVEKAIYDDIFIKEYNNSKRGFASIVIKKAVYLNLNH